MWCSREQGVHSGWDVLSGLAKAHFKCEQYFAFDSSQNAFLE